MNPKFRNCPQIRQHMIISGEKSKDGKPCVGINTHDVKEQVSASGVIEYGTFVTIAALAAGGFILYQLVSSSSSLNRGIEKDIDNRTVLADKRIKQAKKLVKETGVTKKDIEAVAGTVSKAVEAGIVA